MTINLELNETQLKILYGALAQYDPSGTNHTGAEIDLLSLTLRHAINALRGNPFIIHHVR